MYDMYPDRWADVDADQRQRLEPAERPRRRVRRSHESRPTIIRVREERRSADR